MRVTKAVITAAGRNQRALPLQTLIDRDGAEKAVLCVIVEEALRAGIEEICVVVCPGDEAAYAAAVGEHGGRLTFVQQEEPLGHGHAVFCARPFVDGEPFLHLVGDHLYVSGDGAGCARQIVALAEAESCAVSAVQPSRESLLPYYGTIGGRRVPGRQDLYVIEDVIEKPTPTEAEQRLLVPGLRAGHYLCFFGMHVLTPTVMEILEQRVAQASSPSPRTETVAWIGLSSGADRGKVKALRRRGGYAMPRRPWMRDQMWLMPPTLDDLVPASHPVRFIAAFVDQLVPSELGLCLETAERGGVEYDPRMMLAAWIYGFMTRTRSTRRLERAAKENLPLIWLLGGAHPDHSTLSRFLAANHAVLQRLFKQTVRTAVDVGLVAFAFQAVDGTRVSAVSADKMLDRAALEALEQRVDEAMAQMERAVGEEEQGTPADPAAPEMPPALHNPRELKARIGAALATVAEREASRTSHHGGATDPRTGQPRGPVVHLADPEAVVMKGRHGYVAGYNAQAAVDAQARIIVAADVIAQASDQEALVPMLGQIRATTGRLAAVTALDGGYHSAANLEAMAGTSTELYVADPALKRQAAQGERAAFHKDAFVYDSATDTYRCPRGETLHFAYLQGGDAEGAASERVYRCRACGGCPQRALCTRDRHGRRIRVRPEDARLRAHRAKMRTPEARAMMRRRGATVEPVFGIMREHMGLTRFLRRGLAKVRAEWHLLCAAFNLRVLWKAWWLGQRQVTAVT